MRGLILFIVAKILIAIFYPIGFFYSITLTLFKNGWKAVDIYLLNCAIASDQGANVYLAKLFNDWLVKPGGYRFGNVDETISSVLGRNYQAKTLSILGIIINWILNKLEKDHTTKYIEELGPKSKNIV